MKIYLVWEVNHSWANHSSRLVKIFSSQESAAIAVAELELYNTDPVESDDYGPFQGTEYHSTEWKVLS